MFEARKMIAGFLAQRRAELGMTQEALAERTGMGIATVKRFESGRFWLSSKHLLMLCHVLDCYFFLEAKGSDSPHATKRREAMEQANRFRNPSEGQKN